MRRKNKKKLTGNQIILIITLPMVMLWGIGITADGNTVKEQQSTPKPTEVSTPAPTTTPDPIPTIKPTPIPTPTPTNKPKSEKLPPDLDIPLDYDIQRYIYRQCKNDNDLYCFVMAIIEQESGFNEKEVSSTNDYGLMQINACNHDDLQDKYGNKDFLDPYDNVYCGIRIIRGYLKEFEYKNLALMVYNMGRAGARKLWREEIYSTKYSDSVLEKYRKYLQQSEKEM